MSNLGNTTLGSIVLGSPTTFGDPFEPNIVHNLSLTHLVENGIIPKTAGSTLSLSQTVSYVLRRLRLISTIPLSQTVSFQLTKNITVTQSITLTQTARRIHEISISQTLDTLQSSLEQTSKSLPQTLNIVQDLHTNITRNKEVTHALNIRQRIRQSRILPRSLSNTIQLVQKVKQTRAFPISISQNTNITQELVRSRYTIAVSQTLSLTQTLAKIRVIPKTVTQLLLPTQVLSRNVIIERTVEQTIEFKDTRTIKFFDQVFNIPKLQYTITNPNAFVNARIRAQLPDDPSGLIFQLYQTGIVLGQYRLVPRMPHLTSSNNYVILYTENEAITLPAPVFGDSEAETGTINLRKAMDGTTYTYVKRQDTRKLHYDFEIDRQKSLQLRDFIKTTNSKIVNLINWKGEIWVVKYLSNPFVFTKTKLWAPTGEAVSVSLEFEGIRTN